MSFAESERGLCLFGWQDRYVCVEMCVPFERESDAVSIDSRMKQILKFFLSVRLLQDSSILFIIIRATGDAALAKAMDVAEMAKKKTRQSKDEPLRQYVIDDSATSSPQLPGSWGRSRTGSTPEPPTKRISIYLSKIDLPDLQRRPQTDVGGKSSSERSSNILSKTSKNGNAQAPPRPPPRPTSGASNGSGKSSHSNSASSMPGSFPGSTDDASGDGSKSGGRWGKFLSPKWRQSS